MIKAKRISPLLAVTIFMWFLIIVFSALPTLSLEKAGYECYEIRGCTGNMGCEGDVAWHVECDLYCQTGGTQVQIKCPKK
ncbi:MAG: hypothetical protein AB1410_08770 [Acidobacteriota bacterium]